MYVHIFYIAIYFWRPQGVSKKIRSSDFIKLTHILYDNDRYMRYKINRKFDSLYISFIPITSLVLGLHMYMYYVKWKNHMDFKTDYVGVIVVQFRLFSQSNITLSK